MQLLARLAATKAVILSEFLASRLLFAEKEDHASSSRNMNGVANAEFNLDGRRNALDEAAMVVAEFQEETVTKRKDLAQSTRTLKTKVSQESSKEIGPVLKQYQTEVNRLTQRCAYRFTRSGYKLH
jgi:hypothetical protein